MKCPSKRRSQLSRIFVNTGCGSAIEPEITPSTSAEAFCCSSASLVSLKSRTFSMAITAWLAKVRSRASWFSLNGRASARRIMIEPMASPPRMSGVARMVR